MVGAGECQPLFPICVSSFEQNQIPDKISVDKLESCAILLYHEIYHHTKRRARRLGI